jgi:hypothetical protein
LETRHGAEAPVHLAQAVVVDQQRPQQHHGGELIGKVQQAVARQAQAGELGHVADARGNGRKGVVAHRKELGEEGEIPDLLREQRDVVFIEAERRDARGCLQHQVWNVVEVVARRQEARLARVRVQLLQRTFLKVSMS